MTDDFNGDDAHLVSSIEALLELDADNALVPHGVGGHARKLLEAAACRLVAPVATEQAQAVATPAAPSEILDEEDIRDLANTHGFTGDYEEIARVVESMVLEKMRALAQPAPVQQDAPAPSMVGDAKGGA